MEKRRRAVEGSWLALDFASPIFVSLMIIQQLIFLPRSVLLLLGIACDRHGNVIVAGLTTSPDFPVTSDAHQSRNRGGADANTCWRFIQAVRDDDALWAHGGVVGYHLYGGEARNSDRSKLRDFAVAKGLLVGHAGSDGITPDTLYDDLTLGGVSC